MIIKFIKISLLLIILSSCAYFNMFFNAKKHFDSAEQKRKEMNKIDKGLYEKSIVELSKILEFYPSSKWVDDALLMMGQCYYRQEKFDKAKRKCLEIISNYPESDLQSKARALLAEVEIGLKNYDTALKLIENIELASVDINQVELKKLNAELSLSLKDSSKALKLYMEAAQECDSPGEKITFLTSASEISESIKDHKNSAVIFEQLIENSESREKKFENTLKYANSIEKQGYSDSARVIIENILSIEEFDQYSLKGNVKLGELYYASGMYEESYDKLDEILRTNQKTRENAGLLSESAFYMGEYFFNYKKDLKNAETMYDSSRFFDRGNKFNATLTKRKRSIDEFLRIKKQIPMAQIKIDSTKIKISRLDRKLKNLTDSDDPGSREKIISDKEKLQKELKNKTKEIIRNKMTLADKFLNEIVYPDSAEMYLKEVSETEYLPHSSSRALYMLHSMDTIKYAGLEDSILIKYPKTLASNAIRKKRGLELVTIVEDSAEYYYNLASDIFLDSLYNEAVEEYLSIAEKYEDSPLSPKIMKAAGLIAENYIIDMDLAADIYTKLEEKYPKTVDGKFASKKLRADGSVKKERTEKKSETDADRWYMMDRRNK